MLLSDTNVTCFVLQLAHLLAQREDKAFRIRLKRFVFCTFQLPLTWRKSPSPTQCANPRMERRRAALKMETKMRPVDIKMERLHWFVCSVHDIPETITVSAKVFDWDVCLNVCSVFTTLPWRLTDFLMFAWASNGTNAKSLTQFLKWVQKRNSLLSFPHSQVTYI